ncbi:MAG: hypothetical protein IKT40_12340 [Bacilli bacterium]|nr:hypothetical protein [Bacilli bacterium]
MDQLFIHHKEKFFRFNNNGTRDFKECWIENDILFIKTKEYNQLVRIPINKIILIESEHPEEIKHEQTIDIPSIIEDIKSKLKMLPLDGIKTIFSELKNMLTME